MPGRNRGGPARCRRGRDRSADWRRSNRAESPAAVARSPRLDRGVAFARIVSGSRARDDDRERLEQCGLLDFPDSVLRLVLRLVIPRVELVRRRVVGIQREGPFEMRFGFRPVPVIEQVDDTERRVYLGAGRIQSERPLCGLFCQREGGPWRLLRPSRSSGAHNSRPAQTRRVRSWNREPAPP